MRYKWEIVGTAAVCVLAALLASFAVTPVYRGSATLLIEAQPAKVVDIDEVQPPENPTLSSEHRNTQVEVLRSRALAEKVFERLNLRQSPEYEQSRDDGFLGAFLASDEDPVEKLMGNIRIEPVLNTKLIRIHAESEDAQLSAEIANGVLTAYMENERAARSDVTREATEWLTQRLEQIKGDLERSERALQDFYDDEKLVNVGGARGLVEDEVTDNARRLREAQRVRTELENVQKRIAQAGNDIELLQEIPAIQQEPLVQSTRRSFLDAREQVGQLETRYGSRHPKMIAAQARLEEARGAYEKQVRVAAEGIRSQNQIARSTEESLAGVVEVSRSQIQSLDRKQHEFELLQREVDTNRRLFETFLDRIKEADIAGNLDIGETRTIEHAEARDEPYKPRRELWLLSAGLVGLMLGVGLAFTRAHLDDAIRTPVDLARATSLPLLSVLPVVADSGKLGERIARIEIDDPTAPFAEGIRTLRTRIMLARPDREPRTMLVTSAMASEGKSSVALNLAIAMGRVERVLLLDADLRRPSIASMIGLPKTSKGVVDVISATTPLAECIYVYKEGNISVMPSGTESRYALELLGSARFAQLLHDLGSRYDRILIDSPPCHPVSDALLLSRRSDAVVFLVKAGSTPAQLVKTWIGQLEDAGAQVVGVVLNQADLRRYSGYAYGYYHHDEGKYGPRAAG